MSILITGGAGYIGSHTCKALALAGHVPVVYDNLSSGHRRLVRWGDFVHGDIRDTASLAGAMRAHAVEGVIHFAALADVGQSVRDPESYYSVNVAGSLSVLRAMHQAGVLAVDMRCEWRTGHRMLTAGQQVALSAEMLRLEKARARHPQPARAIEPAHGSGRGLVRIA